MPEVNRSVGVLGGRGNEQIQVNREQGHLSRNDVQNGGIGEPEPPSVAGPASCIEQDRPFHATAARDGLV